MIFLRTTGLFLFLAPGLLPAPAPPAGCEAVAAPPVLLRVTGDVPRALELTAEAFARLPRQAVRVKDRDGPEVTYEGVAVAEVLRAAGVEFGHDRSGGGLASYLVVEGDDGYRALFALPELDPGLTDRVVLLADRRDGQALKEGDGPLRAVVPGEKRASRWVKRVVRLKVGKA